MSDLQDQECRECRKSIRVAHYSPWEGEEKPTGCAASAWDDDRERFVGWICLDCAFAAAMRTEGEPGPRGILGGPGPDWSFGYK